jgi:uncharacterized GH25 family protein
MQKIIGTENLIFVEKNFTFTSTITKYPGLGGWFFVQLPQKYYNTFKSMKKKIGYGFIPIKATVGKTTWQTSLLPGKGMYFIALKAEVRKKEKLSLGDKIKISFKLL